MRISTKFIRRILYLCLPIGLFISQQVQSTPVHTPITEQSKKNRLRIGDNGPSGGIVFYIDASGLHGLEAKKADEATELELDEAITACSSYGLDWRLPTQDELNLLYNRKKVVGGFSSDHYWSSEKLGWSKSFDTGSHQYGTRVSICRASGGCSLLGIKNRVRAVKFFSLD